MTILFAVVLVVHAQRFHNPVIDNEDNPDPGVFLYNGTYYAVTTTGNTSSPDKYPIHISKDLQNWTKIGYVFNETTLPLWSKLKTDYWAPEIHEVNGKFLVYYTSHDVENDQLAIGVAVGDSPEGPYTSLDKALVVFSNTWAADATLIRDPNGQLVLSWVSNYNIRARNLTDDGLAFKDNNTVLLIKPDQDWEGGETEAPWYLYRNGYHYIFYSMNNFCGDKYALGVARSNVSSVGPYEKLPYPLLVSDDDFKGPGHGSIVRDIDGEGYVFVHHAYKAGAVCTGSIRLLFSTTMFWGDDNWPRNMTIGD